MKMEPGYKLCAKYIASETDKTFQGRFKGSQENDSIKTLGKRRLMLTAGENICLD